MASEPSWGPSIGNRPLKWTEIGPTNDPWMVSDEFETFGNNHFWRKQTKTKMFIPEIIHFMKIQNIHSKQIFIFFKSRIFIQENYSFFLKSQIFIQKKYSFFWKRPYRPGLSTYGDGGGGLPYEPNLESSIRRHPFRKEMKMKWRNSGTTVSRLICCFYFARKSGHTQRKGEGPSWRLTLPTFFEILSFVGPDDIEYIITFYLIVFYCFFLEFQFAMVLS